MRGGSNREQHMKLSDLEDGSRVVTKDYLDAKIAELRAELRTDLFQLAMVLGVYAMVVGTYALIIISHFWH